jgi:hypothetical protein
MYYVADVGAFTLWLAALRAAATSTATMLVFVSRFLFRILPLFPLNPIFPTKSTLGRRDPVGAQCLRPEHFSSLLYGFGMTAFLVLLAF